MIHVEGIGKRYRLGQSIRHDTLRDAIMHRARIGKRRSNPIERRDEEHFWALRDVSFDVGEGEVVGIIGRNGAGKSTLLKILSRITPPTEGRIRLRGRIASLLEIGTGFHPELSGRENIYMNGAILGMRRQEIRAKFDEIVSFAEVEKFLDTPVKRYSSGMYVRLAFAIAAHLEPEILIVDEVLAVGDAEFQKKCLGKMGEVARGGRTVLFVSHNMSSVEGLCTRAILLAGGRKAACGNTKEIIGRYLNEQAGSGTVNLSMDKSSRFGDGAIRVTRMTSSLSNGSVSSVFALYEQIRITCSLEGPADKAFHLGIGIFDSLGNQIIHQSTLHRKLRYTLGPKGEAHVALEFENILNAGNHYVTCWVGGKFEVTHDYAKDCLKIVSDTTNEGQASGRVKGAVIPKCCWSEVEVEDLAR
jgi:lipopolysaccharide transport system ATP-binding protein